MSHTCSHCSSINAMQAGFVVPNNHTVVRQRELYLADGNNCCIVRLLSVHFTKNSTNTNEQQIISLNLLIVFLFLLSSCGSRAPDTLSWLHAYVRNLKYWKSNRKLTRRSASERKNNAIIQLQSSACLSLFSWRSGLFLFFTQHQTINASEHV